MVGAGPAGMMAAGSAEKAGAHVLLLEKNREAGKKLLISGGGRCNFTNAEPDLHRLVSRYGEEGKALFSPFSRLGPNAVLEFFSSRGMPYKIEDNNRAFPVSNSAGSVRDVLQECMAGVEFRTRTPVQGLLHNESGVYGVRLEHEELHAAAVVIATGGLARPDTGSTGDGYAWLERLGHSIVRPEPSLVPVVVAENWISELQGLSFNEVRIAVRLGGKPMSKVDGKVLFTHFGLSGPAILNLATTVSRVAAKARQDGLPAPQICLNFFPSLDGGSLDRILMEQLSNFPKRQLKTVLESMLPPRLARRILLEAATHIGAGDAVNFTASTVPKLLRKQIVRLMQEFPLTYRELQSEDWAVVSSGGVPTNEVDFRTMQSKRVNRLFVCGDMLNINRPSGGYSLQICWATGYVAGLSAAESAGNHE